MFVKVSDNISSHYVELFCELYPQDNGEMHMRRGRLEVDSKDVYATNHADNLSAFLSGMTEAGRITKNPELMALADCMYDVANAAMYVRSIMETDHGA